MAQQLRTYLQDLLSQVSTITAVYLFGSFVRDKARAHSDLDLAFLFADSIYKRDPFEAMGNASMLAAQIARQFDRETDLTILNAASIEIAYEIVTSGCCVYTGGIGTRIEYEAVIRGMYYDFQPFLKELRSNCIACL